MKNNIKFSIWALVLLTTQIIYCPEEGNFESPTNQAPHDNSPELHNREVTHYPTDNSHYEHNQNRNDQQRVATAPPEEDDQDHSTGEVGPIIRSTFTFHEPNKEQTEQPRDNVDGVSAARRDEIEHMLPARIADADEDDESNPIHWSPAELKLLSYEQTNALTAIQLTHLQINNKISDLHISDVNPQALAQVFNYANRREPWTDEMVQQLTEEQTEAILKTNSRFLKDYFTPDQLAMMRTGNTVGDASVTIATHDENPEDDLKKGTKQKPEEGFSFHKPEKNSDDGSINIPLSDEEVSIERQKAIAKLTPEDIAALDFGETPEENIAEWSISELKLLSPDQLNALTPAQLTELQINGKITHLDIRSLNPKKLATMLTFDNKGQPWSDLMINDLTPLQKQAILDSNSPFLDDYFSLKQIAKMRAQIEDQSLPSDLPYQPQEPTYHPQVATAPPAEDETPRDWGATAPPADDDNPQPTPEDQPVATPQQEKGIVAKAIAAIKSSWFGKLISDQIDSINDHLSKAKARRTAASLARMKAEGTFEKKNQPFFDDAMKKLTTKEKENVANQWLDSKEKIYQAQQSDLKAQIIELQNKARKINDNESSTPADLRISDAYELKITELSDKIHANMDQFAQARKAFTTDMQNTLTPNEVMMELSSTVKPYNTEFEIMDMHKIDPTKSIADQYKKLSDDMNTSKHILSTGKTGRITAKAILDTYTTWITGKITLEPTSETSILEQLNNQMKSLTGKTFSECDSSIREAIIDKLPQDAREKYTIETNKQIEAAKEPLRRSNNITRNKTFLSLSPEIISQKIHPDYIKYLTPETIAKLTLAQIQALTPDQLKMFSPEQIQALTPDQIAALQLDVAKLTPTQITNLSDIDLHEIIMQNSITRFTTEQIQGLTPHSLRYFIKDFTPDQIKDLTNQQIQQFNINHIPWLKDDQIAAFTKEQIQTLTPQQIRVFNPDQIHALTPDQINSLSNEQFLALNISGEDIATTGFTPEQQTALHIKLMHAEAI